MARPLRIDIVDGWYHVAGRGIDRRNIFTDQRDREHFLELLAGVVERYRIVLHAHVLMSNHYHLIVQTPEANLSAAIQWLSVSYSMWFNRRHNRVGPLFQGRFKSIPVEGSGWAYELSLYVHLNPVMRIDFGLHKIGKQAEGKGYKVPSKQEVNDRLAEIRAYQWSSYRAYAGYCKKPDWLTTKDVLSRATCKKEDSAAKYRQDAKHRLTQGVSESFQERIKNGLALGAEKFVGKIKELSEGGGRETPGKKDLRREVEFEDVVKAVEKLKELDFERIIATRGDWGKPLLIFGARQFCGMTLSEIGSKLKNMDYAAVAMNIRRFEEKIEKDKKLKNRFDLLKEMLNVKT